MPWKELLGRPGVAGPFGALMDEYARAADDFCATLETLHRDRFMAERPSDDPDTRSIRALCAHTIGAAYGYADYIREARGIPSDRPPRPDASALNSPTEVRPLLAAALRYTESSLEGLYEADGPTVEALTFRVRWGPTYDPEMILEHGIVHLLRHRRQVERWPA